MQTPRLMWMNIVCSVYIAPVSLDILDIRKGFLLSLVALARGTCEHDISGICHTFTKSDCATNQWMRINCCHFCGLHHDGSSSPVDGHWGSWGSWSQCSVSCGSGLHTRRRLCNSPSPSHGGADCPGDSAHTHKCHVAQCPADGHWGSWGSWSLCSTSCGSGVHTRRRLCNRPSPRNGGADCPGDSAQTQRCHVAQCPVDGHWGSWGNWSQCSASCGSGVRTRIRHCNNPSPRNGGADCPGDSAHTYKCHLAQCHESLTCLSCQGVLFPHTCDTVEHCGSHSICSIERYFDGAGNTHYNLGCKDTAFCQSKAVRSPVQLIENYTAEDSYRSNIPYCRECCTTFMCNLAGCGNTGYAEPHGPICFACTQQLTLDSCNTIQLCGRDEVCSIEGGQFGSVNYFTSACKSRITCELSGYHLPPIGRDVKETQTNRTRRSSHICDRCCSGDLCNHTTC